MQVFAGFSTLATMRSLTTSHAASCYCLMPVQLMLIGLSLISGNMHAVHKQRELQMQKTEVLRWRLERTAPVT